MNPQRFVLPNGLVLLVQENRANATVALMGTLRAGAIYDPPQGPGLAGLTAGLLDRGTSRRTSSQIAEQLDFIGASFAVEAMSEVACFSAHCLSEHFEPVLDLVGEMLLHPAFFPEELAKLREEVLTVLQEQEENPESRSLLEFYSLLYPDDHPYHRNPLGTQEGISGSERADLLAFYERYYRPDDTILVVVGDVSTGEVREKVGRTFGGWKARGRRPPSRIPCVPLPGEPKTRVIPMEDKGEVIIHLGHTGIARSDPDYPACQVMNTILGGGSFGSRLTTRLREERGLTYAVYSQFQAGLGAGPWLTYLQVNPRDVEEAIVCVKTTLEEIREDGVTAGELKLVQDYLAGRLFLSLESNADIATLLRNEELYGLGLDYVERYPSLIRGVTREQVRQMARKQLHPDRLITVIAGPYK